MAQKGNKRKQAPAYSADTMALRFIGGLALAALGVMIFMAVDLRMQGTIFTGLRGVCYGLCGGLAVVLPVIPLWAGALVIWSTQKRAPVKPWIFGTLAFIGICVFVVLITRTPDSDYLTYLTGNGRGGWGDAIQAGYEHCATKQASGGAVGVTLAWPLWTVFGTVLSVILIFLATVFCVLMAVNLTPRRIQALATGQAKRYREQQEIQRQQAEQQQVEWQRQQAIQQAAWQQQQAQIIEQQQAYAQQQAYQQQGHPQQAYQQGGQPAYQQAARQQTPAQIRMETAMPSDVEVWQDQNTMLQTAAAVGSAHQSRIFGKKNQEPTAGENKPHRSKIFKRREEKEEDGLLGDEAFATRNSQEMGAAGEAKPVRKTATGREINGSETRWTQTDSRGRDQGQSDSQWAQANGQGQRGNQEQTGSNAAGKAQGTAGQSRIFNGKAEQKGVQRTTDPSPYQRPVEQGTQTSMDLDRPESQMGTTARNNGGDRRSGGWSDQVDARLADMGDGKTDRRNGQMTDTNDEKPAGRNQREDPSQRQDPYGRTSASTKPPVVQPIGEKAYKPDLKLSPKPESGEAEEDSWEPIPYTYPPITDLAMPKQLMEDTAAEDAMRSQKLEETLASFKVQARVVNVTHGPAISRFEMELAAGTKVNKVAELEKDIAYGMSATSVRIEAPIPGKSLVGVEVPNRKVATVTLREVLESEKMQSAKSLLTVALGRDIAGTPIICDLAKMPHMLIAGQTGSGKSVCINAIINSLLYRAGPDEVKMILVDPKVVELQCYNGIPHLLIPVVNDPHKAAAALAWAVAEMMERYDKFAERKVRNLDGYNSVLGPHEKPMTRIVIIIDELADLMMVCKKDVEEYICRLTQLARAAGIHLIVATQRPSVDVITGLIKANIPSRIAFKTASSVDSRTILDRNGAEQLLGWGDMLYAPTGSFSPTRVQGCFLSDDEVNQIVTHVRQGNPSSYDPDILEKLEELSGGSGPEIGGADILTAAGDGTADGNLFEQAVEFAIADGQISTSTLQRRLKIGYARAGRLTDEMEERGIVAAKDGSKPRKCLITREEWEEMKKSTEGMS